MAFRCILSICVLSVFASVALAELPPGCVEDTAMPDDQYSALYDKLKDTPCKFPVYMRLYELEQYLSNKEEMKGFGLSPEQTVEIGSLFDDGGSFDQLVLDGAMTALGPHTLGLACTDGATLLELSSNQNTRIDILKAIVNISLDLGNNSALYVDKFEGFLYKEEAKRIVNEATPYGCTFGNTSVVKRLAFVIDTSGSMSTTFPGPEGTPISRMAFVQQQLNDQIRMHLSDDQEFNIIQFSSSASQWQPGVQPVTDENIASAVAFAEKLSPSGSTNMIGGLTAAMKDSKVEGIFLLTDGAPDGSKTAIIDAVTAWSQGKKPVFPTAFMAGTDGDWMQELADKTGGMFRKIDA